MVFLQLFFSLSRRSPSQEQRTKNDKNVSLLKTFLQRKVELRNVEEIPPAQLNEMLSEFALTVRTKDGNDYEPTSRPWKRLRVLSSSSDED